MSILPMSPSSRQLSWRDSQPTLGRTECSGPEGDHSEEWSEGLMSSQTMAHWEEIFGGSSDCVKIIDLFGCLRSINSAGRKVLGIAPGDQLGMPWLEVLPSGVRDSGLVAVRDVRNGMRARFEGRTESADGIQIWDNVLTPIFRAGRPAAILCVSRDISSLHSNYSEVRRLSETDELTSLLNRRGLLTGVRKVLNASGTALSAGVVLVDVDDLKGINAAHGYEAGNRAIRQVAARIRASSPPGTVIGRWGGDEFVVFSDGRTAARQLDLIEAKLYSSLRASSDYRRDCLVTATVAAAQFPTEGSSVDALVDAAGRKLATRKPAWRRASRRGA